MDNWETFEEELPYGLQMYGLPLFCFSLFYINSIYCPLLWHLITMEVVGLGTVDVSVTI